MAGGAECLKAVNPSPPSSFVLPTHPPPSENRTVCVSRSCSLPENCISWSGRLEREPVAMVTTGLQTRGKDEVVAGCVFLTL